MMIKNMSINVKILMMVTIPILGAFYFGIREINLKQSDRDEMIKINNLMSLTLDLGSLVHELQAERGMSAGYISSKGTKFGDIGGKHQLTNEYLNKLKKSFSSSEGDLSEKQIQRIKLGLTELKKVDDIRNRVLSSKDKDTIKVSGAVKYYTDINNIFLSVIPLIIEECSNSKVMHDLVSYNLFVRGKEFAGIERALLAAAFNNDSLKGELRSKYFHIYENQGALLREFQNIARPKILNIFKETLVGPDVKEVENMRAVALSAESGYGIDSQKWFNASTARIKLLKQIESAIGKEISAMSVLIGDQANMTFRNSVIILVSILAMVIIATIVIRNSIVQMLRKAINIIRDIAEGEGRLDQRVNIDSKDEIGEMSKWIDIFIEKIHKIVIDIQHKSKNLVDDSQNSLSSTEIANTEMEQVRGKSDEVASATEQLSMNIKNVSEVAQNMYAEISKSMESADIVSKSMNDVNKVLDASQSSITSIATSSEEMTATIKEISSNAEQSRSISIDAVSTVEAAGTQVEELAESSAKIEKVIEIINEISEQTKNLALNATIEAARAGEAGKGFAVVANEVKELAKETVNATSEIRETIDEMKSCTEKTVSKISDVKNIIESVNEMTVSIATSIEEQSTALQDNSRSTQVIAENLSDVFNKIRTSTDHITEITTNMKLINSGAEDAANNSREASTATNEMVRNLLGINEAININSDQLNQVTNASSSVRKTATDLDVLVGHFQV